MDEVEQNISEEEIQKLFEECWSGGGQSEAYYTSRFRELCWYTRVPPVLPHNTGALMSCSREGVHPHEYYSGQRITMFGGLLGAMTDEA